MIVGVGVGVGALVGLFGIDGGAVGAGAGQKTAPDFAQALPNVARVHIKALRRLAHGFQSLKKIVIEAANMPNGEFEAVGKNFDFGARHAYKRFVYAGAGVIVGVQGRFDGVTQAAQGIRCAGYDVRGFVVCRRQCHVVNVCRVHGSLKSAFVLKTLLVGIAKHSKLFLCLWQKVRPFLRPIRRIM